MSDHKPHQDSPEGLLSELMPTVMDALLLSKQSLPPSNFASTFSTLMTHTPLIKGVDCAKPLVL